MSDTNTRDRILAVTRECLAQPDGLDTITIGAVAAAANISRATLYRYFPNKTALLQAAGVSSEELTNLPSTRERIIAATLEVVGERGVHSTTFEEIADRTGISVSGLHWHYKNKDELFAAIAQHVPFVPTIAANVAQVIAGDVDIETQLTGLLTTLLSEARKRRGMVRYVLFEAEIYPDVAQLASRHSIGRALPLLVELFEQYERQGILRPGSAQVRAQALLGMLLAQVLFRPALTSLPALDDAATARAYVDILLHGIMAQPQSDAAK